MRMGRRVTSPLGRYTAFTVQGDDLEKNKLPVQLAISLRRKIAFGPMT
jgi:hypothetical protein